MSNNESKLPENSTSQKLNQQPLAPKSAHATPVVEKYVEKRTEKAEKQIDEEEKEAAPAQTKTVWNEMVSYKYAIF